MIKKGYAPEQIINKLKQTDNYSATQRYIVFQVEFDLKEEVVSY